MGYIYKKCSRCGIDKIHNRGAYCKVCSKNYHDKYRKEKTKVESLDRRALNAFVKGVIKNDFNVEFVEINTIIDFYGKITKNINEFNDFETSEQIVMMWEVVFKYYKRYIKTKNI